MNYVELTITLYLKKKLHFKDAYSALSGFINEAMKYDDDLSKLHFKNRFKHYVFDLIYNPSIKTQEGFYTDQNAYSFRLRSINEAFIDTIKTLFEKVNNPFFSFISAKKRVQKQFFISKLESVTPTVMITDTVNNKPVYWTLERDGDIIKLHNQLQSNLLKKYANFYGETLHPTQNFIQLLEIKNRVPQTITFKKGGHMIKFFGNKFSIVPNEDEISQKIAFLALGVGLGEKTSYGGGFMKWEGVR